MICGETNLKSLIISDIILLLQEFHNCRLNVIPALKLNLLYITIWLTFFKWYFLWQSNTFNISWTNLCICLHGLKLILSRNLPLFIKNWVSVQQEFQSNNIKLELNITTSTLAILKKKYNVYFIWSDCQLFTKWLKKV